MPFITHEQLKHVARDALVTGRGEMMVTQDCVYQKCEGKDCVKCFPKDRAPIIWPPINGMVHNGFEYVSPVRLDEQLANPELAVLIKPHLDSGVHSDSDHEAECAGFLSAHCERQDPHCCDCDGCVDDQTFIDLDPPGDVL